jgi:hypothetical protein
MMTLDHKESGCVGISKDKEPITGLVFRLAEHGKSVGARKDAHIADAKCRLGENIYSREFGK